MFAGIDIFAGVALGSIAARLCEAGKRPAATCQSGKKQETTTSPAEGFREAQIGRPLFRPASRPALIRPPTLRAPLVGQPESNTEGLSGALQAGCSCCGGSQWPRTSFRK